MSKAYGRLNVILKKIMFIEAIVQESGSITQALEDEKSARAAIDDAFCFYRRHFVGFVGADNLFGCKKSH